MTHLLQKPLRELIAEIEDPRVSALLQMYDDYKDIFHYAPGSSHNHQAWTGGYADHIAEIIRINYVTYDALNSLRKLPFNRDEATTALLFHDIEKPFRYGPQDNAECNKWRAQFTSYQEWEDGKWDILSVLEQRYGFKLTEAERHAIKYAHGEGDDYRKDTRVATPLSSHVHHCDDASARIYAEDGKGLG